MPSLVSEDDFSLAKAIFAAAASTLALAKSTSNCKISCALDFDARDAADLTARRSWGVSGFNIVGVSGCVTALTTPETGTLSRGAKSSS
jgi:hypothetical protein